MNEAVKQLVLRFEDLIRYRANAPQHSTYIAVLLFLKAVVSEILF